MTTRNASLSTDAAGVLLIRFCIYGFIALAVTRTWVDPDLWGHVRFGGDILSTGLTRTDPYSFASDIPWTNHEWLAEVLFYLSYVAGGGAGLIALKALLLAAAVALVLSTIRHTGMPPVTRDFLLFAALAGMWPRVYVLRPQVFSVALFIGLLSVMRSAEDGRLRWLATVPVLFALWVNLHGGWIVGYGVLALWITLTLVQRDDPRISARGLLATGVVALAATLANPYGTNLWAFLATTVRPNRPNIDDWRPLLQSGIGFIVPWTICAVLATVAFVRRQPRIPWSHAAIVGGLGMASIRVSRLDVFFSVSVVMLLAPQIASAAGAASPVTARPVWSGRWRAAAIAVVLAWSAILFAARAQFTCVLMNVPWMPEREAAAFIRDNHLQGRLLAWFNWGQYAIWHFGPALEVSLDGRRETVYSDAYVRDHLRLYYDPASETGFLERLNADYAWLPTALPLTSGLEKMGWHRVYAGPVSVVLARSGRAFTSPAPVEGRACFPGP